MAPEESKTSEEAGYKDLPGTPSLWYWDVFLLMVQDLRSPELRQHNETRLHSTVGRANFMPSKSLGFRRLTGMPQMPPRMKHAHRQAFIVLLQQQSVNKRIATIFRLSDWLHTLLGFAVL